MGGRWISPDTFQLGHVSPPGVVVVGGGVLLSSLEGLRPNAPSGVVHPIHHMMASSYLHRVLSFLPTYVHALWVLCCCARLLNGCAFRLFIYLSCHAVYSASLCVSSFWLQWINALIAFGWTCCSRHCWYRSYEQKALFWEPDMVSWTCHMVPSHVDCIFMGMCALMLASVFLYAEVIPYDLCRFVKEEISSDWLLNVQTMVRKKMDCCDKFVQTLHNHFWFLKS